MNLHVQVYSWRWDKIRWSTVLYKACSTRSRPSGVGGCRNHQDILWLDQDILFQSSQVVASCKLLEEIVVVNVKRILSVIAMIPHMPTLSSGIAEERFFAVEKPGLDLSDLGVPYPSYEEYEVDDNDANDDLE